MTRKAIRSAITLSAITFSISTVLSPVDVRSETMSEPNSAEAPPAYLGTTTQRLMEKTNELDKMHIEREKVISEKAYPSGSGGTKCSDGCGLTA
jgi:hypothetical protein